MTVYGSVSWGLGGVNDYWAPLSESPRTTVTMYVGDVRDTLEQLAADYATFDLVVTSPPFLALRGGTSG